MPNDWTESDLARAWAPRTLHPYANYPDHPLHDVDIAIIDTARAAMQQAVETNDVSPDMADPIADMIVMSLKRYLTTFKDPGTKEWGPEHTVSHPALPNFWTLWDKAHE